MFKRTRFQRLIMGFRSHTGFKGNPYKFSREDLLYPPLERHDSDVNPEFKNKFLAEVGTPIAKVFNFLLYGKWAKGKVYRSEEVLIPLSDGAKLATDVYLPGPSLKKHQKLPTILIRTPYWKDSIAFIGHVMALRGYAGVLQDIRGCGHSNPYGQNSFLMTERQDGLDTARWISKQFWYNGKIGMWGASYFGMTQWAVSWDNDDLITCLVPAVSSNHMLWSNHNGLEMNAIKGDFVRILHEVTKFRDPQSPARFMQESTHRRTEAMRLDPRYALYNDPVDQSNFLGKIEDLKGKSPSEIQAWINQVLGRDICFSKSDFPEFLRLINQMMWDRKINFFSKYMTGMLDYDASQQKTPVYIIAGWYDMFCRVSFQAFMEILEKADSPARERSHLVVGPWSHGNMGHVPRAGLINGGWFRFLRKMAPFHWFDHWLKDKKNTFQNAPQVKIFVMGRNQWRYEKTWPLERAQYRSLYVHSKGNANSLKGDGFLSWDEPNESEHEDTYLFNPMNPVLTRGGNNLMLPKGAFDQRPNEVRDDILIYTSAPLKQGLEVTGPVETVLYAASSAEDTDFFVRLVDVFPSGKALNVLDRGVRARYREFDFNNPSLLEPGKIYEYNIPLGHTANYFQKNHRIRVEITSSDFPKYDVNANLGGKGQPGTWKTALQSIFHDADHPTRLIFPIIP